MLYLIYGPDSFSSEKHLAQVIKFYTQKTSFCPVVDFTDKNTSYDLIELKTLFLNKTLFTSTKVVVLKNLFQGTNTEFRQKLWELLQNFNLATAKDIMIIIYENKDIGKDNFKKWLGQHATGKKIFSLFSTRELNNWIRKRERETGIHLSPLAREMLLMNYGNDLRGLDQVFFKLALLGVKIVSRELLSEIILYPQPSNIFKFLDKLIEKKISSATYFLELELNKGTSATLLLFLLVNQIRNLLKIKVGFSSKTTAKKLNINPFVYRKLMPLSRNIDLAALKKIYARLSYYDCQLKRGLIEENLALEMMFLDLKKILK